MNLGSAVLAIDPGQHKCGVAVVKAAGGAFEALYQGVTTIADLQRLLAELVSRFEPESIVIGNGTNSAHVARTAASATAAPVVVVDERFSTIAARKRFFEQNPPRGLRRLIPLSLQTPSRPYDDYVAVILAEEYLKSR